MIICVSANPAIDRRLRLGRLHAGAVNRATSVCAMTGGKAAHVAMAAAALGDAAADGVEALRLLDEHHFDIMITDLVMPRLDGFALVAETRLKWPNVRIVLMSGYVAEYAAPVLDGSTEFLPKPIDPKLLVATVRRLLPASD